MGESVEQVDSFLRRFESFAAKARQERLSHFRSTFDHIKGRLEPALNLRAERHRLQAPEFDVFAWLGIKRRSEAAHTRVLANLLKPDGTHGQGNLFLERFLRLCQSTLPQFPRVLTGSFPSDVRVVVIDEENSAFGRTDIRVACASAKLPLAMIIENKIDAGLQEHQLERYWDRLQHDFPFAGGNRILLYLTPNGRKPEPCPSGIPYFCISYNVHIARWLESCLSCIEPFAVRGFVSRYAQIAFGLREKGDVGEERS